MTPPFALVIGEVLVDLIEGADDAGSILYRPRFGGSPLNVAVGVRRLGADVEFVGSFGADVFGRRMREFLLSEDVGVDGSMEAGMGTCLSVAISEAGHVDYEYFGDFATMTQIPVVAPRLVSGATVVHAGSTAFNSDPAYAAVVDAYRRTRGFTTMDPNPRPFLIDDLPRYRDELEAAMTMVDLIKLSGDDVAYLYPGATVEQAARQMRGPGEATVIVTQADRDTVLLSRQDTLAIVVPPLEPVDTTGAGDSFMAYIIAAVVRDGPPTDIATWVGLARHANAAAAASCGVVGGATAMPTWEQVEDGIRADRSD